MLKSVTIFYPGGLSKNYLVGDKTPGNMDVKCITLDSSDMVIVECENSVLYFCGLPFCVVEEKSRPD